MNTYSQDKAGKLSKRPGGYAVSELKDKSLLMQIALYMNL